jgi:phthalate 4,5-dioxygenase oxygenase subunit
MLTPEDNELLCRITGQHAMGQMIRRYWIPALFSHEVESDRQPVRVRLMGENLVAFRDSNGEVGLLQELCPHRGASLFLARNEDCGLRCLYHGWKFDVTGRVIEMPTESNNEAVIDRVRALAYPTQEAGGIIWAYMGPEEDQPTLVNFEFIKYPETHLVLTKMRIACNWVQCLEGVLDSAHSNYLHSDTFKPKANANSDYRGDSLVVDRPSGDGKPRFEVENTDYGFRYAAIRKTASEEQDKSYIRTTLFVAPFYGLFAGQKNWGALQAFVPIDDENTMLYFVRYNLKQPVDDKERDRQIAWSGLIPGVDVDEDYRMTRNRENDWLQDRAAMESGKSASGLRGVQVEDAVIQESMGPIFDRSTEHLGSTDVAVVRMRRLMLQAVRGHMKDGKPPLGLNDDIPYDRLRAEEAIISRDTTWQEVCKLGQA